MQHRDLPGRFIVVEGADGAGTSTQAKRLAQELGAIYTHEPTQGIIGQKVQQMISHGGYSPEAISLAFAADRMAHLEEAVIPALENGDTVVSDRYYHSSLVYQPVLGADPDWVQEINRHMLTPNLTLVLDIEAEVGMERVRERGMDKNIFEDLDFQSEVVLRYRDLQERLDEDIRLIDGTRSKDQVFQQVMDTYQDRFSTNK